MARSCNVQRNSDRAIARHDADLSWRTDQQRRSDGSWL